MGDNAAAPAVALPDTVVAGKLETDDEQVARRLEQMEAEAAAQHADVVAKTEAVTVSGITSEKVIARAEEKLADTNAKIAATREMIKIKKQERIDSFKGPQCEEWKAMAVKKQSELAARKVGVDWNKSTVREGAERHEGPFKLALTDEEVDKALEAHGVFTPYKAAAHFMMALYRLNNVRGAKERPVTMKYLKATLHSKCLMAKDKNSDDVIIRKPSLRMLTQTPPEVAASYFDPKPAKTEEEIKEKGGPEAHAKWIEAGCPGLRHPFNEYKVDEDAMLVRFRNPMDETERGYTGEDGNKFKVQILCGGIKPYAPKYRELEMRYEGTPGEGGKWKVILFRKVCGDVCEVFIPQQDNGGVITEEELTREREYRQAFAMEKTAGLYLVEGVAGTDYVAPKADPKIEIVDIHKTKRDKQLAELDIKIKQMSPEEQAALEAAKAEKKKERQVSAKLATKAAVADGKDGDYNEPAKDEAAGDA